MSKLELMKIRSELAAVVSAKLNLQYQIEQALENISRLEEHVKISEATEAKLTKALEEAQKA